MKSNPILLFFSLWFITNIFQFIIFLLFQQNTRQKGVWLDYVLVIPEVQFNGNILQEETIDQTKEFIERCGQDHFYIQLNASDFCKQAVFSLTADYNSGALPCNCDYEGSTSFECDPFGGQCQCKPNIIGRQCDACRTGKRKMLFEMFVINYICSQIIVSKVIMDSLTVDHAIVHRSHCVKKTPALVFVHHM